MIPNPLLMICREAFWVTNIFFFFSETDGKNVLLSSPDRRKMLNICIYLVLEWYLFDVTRINCALLWHLQ